MIEGMIMRIFVFFISALLSFNLAAEECKFSFNESELISSIGIAPVKQEIIKDEGITGNDSNLLIVFYVQIMPDDFVMQLHRF